MDSVQVTQELGETAAVPAMDSGFGVVDLHCHPTMISYTFGPRFWKAHNPPLWWCPWSMRVDFDALAAGGVKAFLCTTYVYEKELFADVWPLRAVAALYPRGRHIVATPVDQLTREYLDFAENMVAETRRLRGDVIETARSFDDMKRVTGAGRICMLHAIEGAHHLNGDIGMVDELAARGVCLMVVPHMYPNEAGGCVNVLSKYRMPGCFNAKYQDASGMTPWGRELIEKLLDVGILVDATHGTFEFRKQTLEIVRNHPKRRPMVMSHACITGDDSTEFGPTRAEIGQIADTGGVIGMMMFTSREKSQHRTPAIDYVLNGIDLLVRYGGEDVVAIGSDFDGTTDVAEDMRSPRDYRALREAMLRKYTEDQVAKFTYGNAERALKNGWGK